MKRIKVKSSKGQRSKLCADVVPTDMIVTDYYVVVVFTVFTSHTSGNLNVMSRLL